ncbi:MAG: RNA-binding domain-containing protein [bacterium]
MALPINIEELFTGQTVEWERIEFREGWNPERTLRTICAFANDFNNWGGGYIILGIEESDGLPVLPPKGVDIRSLDKIQQELNRICRKILPNYYPLVEPVDFQDKKILVLWCPGGSNRPYKAPDSLGKNPLYFYYIRKFSSTVHPIQDEERELLSMTNRVPFDDQVNHNARINDFDLGSIKIYLNEIKSDLEHQIPILPMNEIARKMNIAEGPNENLLPKNIGLFFFAKDVQDFFPYAKIEIVTFDDESGTDYTEKIFTGQLHNQLRGALAYLREIVIKEKVSKLKDRAEANRFFNYPYDALEEALCNAVYHRGYDNDSTIEVRIYPSHIDIISYPGPLPPLDKEKLKNLQFDVRKYRNRRIGEFLKELHLTEGRATGIPSILKSLEKNGSPKPVFETDDERSYFKTTFWIHPEFLKEDLAGTQVRVQVSEQANLLIINNIEEILSKYEIFGEQVGEQVRKQVEERIKPLKKNNLIKILSFTKTKHSRNEILMQIDLSDSYKNYQNYIFPLVSLDLLMLTIPDKPNSPNQQYKTTEKGIKLLRLIKGLS